MSMITSMTSQVVGFLFDCDDRLMLSCRLNIVSHQHGIVNFGVNNVKIF